MWMWSTGINRNIVECKEKAEKSENILCVFVLIETLWNVKYQEGTDYEEDYVVLIETLWNVKINAFLQFENNNTVLIETLWNVKIPN